MIVETVYSFNIVLKTTLEKAMQKEITIIKSKRKINGKRNTQTVI